MSVDVLMRNPLDCGLDSGTLVLDITLKPRQANVDTLPFGEFQFYLMGEDDCLYNTQSSNYTDLGI